MDDKIVTLIIGLAGIISTLVASGLGFYYTARARSSPLREALFSSQLALIIRIMKELGRIRIFLNILAGGQSEFLEQARDDVRKSIKRFSEIQDEGAAILPTDLWIEVKRVADFVLDILVNYDDTNEMDIESIKTFVAMDSKIGLISRNIIGVDELTEESLKLFSSKKEYEKLVNLEIEAIKRIHDQ